MHGSEPLQALPFALTARIQSAAEAHLAQAVRALSQVPGLPPSTKPRPVARIGVLGAGTMGSGIAMNFANAGLSVVLVDTSEAALQRGLAAMRRNYGSAVAKRRLSAEDLDRRMALVSWATSDGPLAECDLVVEAVFEDLMVKTAVCARLGSLCREGAIIATNTSTLDVDLLARASGRPRDMVGMHFFSPAHVMRLLEVVRGAQTAPEVLATIVGLAPALGKVPVVSGVCYGFIGNRMAEPYVREADALLLEGASPSQVDAVAERFGMAMGPCRMLDMAGVDVAAGTVIERGKTGGLPADATYRAVTLELASLGMSGQKADLGYYRYEGRDALPNEATAVAAAAIAARHGIARRTSIADAEIFRRLFHPLVNEGARLLEEGIAARASDIDVVWTSGYGFPKALGGPMWLADRVGLAAIVESLDRLAATRGDPHGYWAPSPLLRRLARLGGSLAAHAQKHTHPSKDSAA